MNRAIIGQNTLKGRGALSNPAGRFDRTGLEAVDDGWYRGRGAGQCRDQRAAGSRARRHHHQRLARTSASTIRSIRTGDANTDASTATRGRATPTWGSRPGLDFETKLFYKADAAQACCEAELARPRYVCKPIMLGANTDPYQPVENASLEVTRSILEVLAATRHPVSIVTKGVLIARDIDLLARDGAASIWRASQSASPRSMQKPSARSSRARPRRRRA